MAGCEFQLTGGFWFETPPGDCNATGLVDQLDYFDFDLEVCITAPVGGIVPGCECFDVDRSGSVTLRDFGIVQRHFGYRARSNVRQAKECATPSYVTLMRQKLIES